MKPKGLNKSLELDHRVAATMVSTSPVRRERKPRANPGKLRGMVCPPAAFAVHLIAVLKFRREVFRGGLPG